MVIFDTEATGEPLGNVSPRRINLNLLPRKRATQRVSITLPPDEGGEDINEIDVFLLFDDTGSFADTITQLRDQFPTIINNLQTSFPQLDLGFGVGRFEDYGGVSGEEEDGRPFTLSQPIIATDTPGFDEAIDAALDRQAPGFGGDGPETLIEGLFQLATGVGLDADGNGSNLDSGPAGLAETQTDPGNSGDVPPFSSFTPDPDNNVLAPSGTEGGAGFRPDSLKIILTATDIGTVYRDDGTDPIIGKDGVTVPLSEFNTGSRDSTLDADGDGVEDGASIQETIDALNELDALVIGLGAGPTPRSTLEAIATLTGTVNSSSTAVDSGDSSDPIESGEPLYFPITNDATALANGITTAISSAVRVSLGGVDLVADDPTARFENLSGTRIGVGGGQSVRFNVQFTGDEDDSSFNIEFISLENELLGAIPVNITTPSGVRAITDSAASLENSSVRIPVLSNDRNLLTTDNIQLVSFTQPSNGTVRLNNNRTPDDPTDDQLIYRPNEGFTGRDSFMYEISDGGENTDSGTAIVRVIPRNRIRSQSIVTSTSTATENNPVIVGTSENDHLIGTDDNDRILGGAGDDTVIGGLGNDILKGGAGSDIFVLSNLSGFDRISDFEVGSDRIELTGGLTAANLTLEDAGNNTLIRSNASNEVLALLRDVTATDILSLVSV